MTTTITLKICLPHDLNSDAHMFALTKENLPEINQFLQKWVSHSI
jgi:hypothetical protein